jgi:hypothetical protein
MVREEVDYGVAVRTIDGNRRGVTFNTHQN